MDTLLRRWRKQLQNHLLPWLLLLLSVTLVLSLTRRPGYLVQLWVPWAEIGMIALVMTGIILTGGIDLSVGAMIALSAMVLGVLWEQAGCPIYVAIAAALLTGTLCGFLNGGLVAWGLSPLVATLATMALFRGLAMTISGAERISDFPPQLYRWSNLGGVPTQYWALLAVAGLSWFVLHHTPFGRRCFAIGDNRLAAEFAAIPVRKVEWSLYTVSGLVAAVVAVLYTVEHDAATPDSHRGLELQAIACVVVGGTSITGGRGGVGSTLLGLAVISNLDIGLKFLGTQIELFTPESRLVIIGLLLILVAIWNERFCYARIES